MAVAQSWLGGIGKYPPHPSRSGNTPLFPRLRLGTSGSITKPLRNRWVFSNPTSPWLCHCPIAIWKLFNFGWLLVHLETALSKLPYFAHHITKLGTLLCCLFPTILKKRALKLWISLFFTIFSLSLPFFSFSFSKMQWSNIHPSLKSYPSVKEVGSSLCKIMLKRKVFRNL